MKRVVFWLGVCLLALVGTPLNRAQAASLNITASHGTWLDQHAPDAAYGENNYAIVGWNDRLGDSAARSLLSFSMSSIPSGSTVSAASLNLYLEGCETDGDLAILAGQMVASWDVSTVTWNSYVPQWSVVSQKLFYSSCSASTWQSVDVTSIIQSWLSTPSSNNGLGLVGVLESGSDWSRRFVGVTGSASLRPYLSVTYTAADTTPPVISGITVGSITKTSALVSWTTDEPAACWISHGPTTAYGTEVSLAPGVHEYSITSLTAGTTYHYKLRCTDAGSHISEWTADQSFTTTAADGTTSTTATTTATTATTSTTTTPTVATATATTATATEKTVSTTVAVPTLTAAYIGETLTPASMTDIVTTTAGDILKVTGKATANLKVAVFVGDKAFTATADKKGVWEVLINTTDVALGSNTVKGQAQDSTKNIGSRIVDLFSLTVNAKPVAEETAAALTVVPMTASVEPTPLTFWQKLVGPNRWWTATAAVAVLSALGGLWYLARKRGWRLSSLKLFRPKPPTGINPSS